MSPSTPRSVPALRVRQWLPAWDDLDYDETLRQARPKEHFYMFALPASRLRALAGIYRRSTDDSAARALDMGIQRKHDATRSDEIRRYVRGGYPWSALSGAKRENPANDDLKKPGWLPTAVVVNILLPDTQREGQTLAAADAIAVHDSPDMQGATLGLPDLNQRVSSVPPLEIIDGQHRLFAFDDADDDVEDYYLPVVAFHGLDISWQAYLFWTINIKPKKINPSLAFDLYPLLREQTWLDSGEAVHVYRESRAQELTEMLWASPTSPWHNRINMLGGARRDYGPVTQAAFIRSLVASMVKSWRPHGGPAGGLFGGTPGTGDGLSWSRIQQAAFLLTAWQTIADAIKIYNGNWAERLRVEVSEISGLDKADPEWRDPAFYGSATLLATDQGVRGFQSIVNDLCYLERDRLGLNKWRDTSDFPEITPEQVEVSASQLRQEPVFRFLQQISIALADFDWRTSGAQDLKEEERLMKSALRGSGGYRELRSQLARHLRNSSDDLVASAASKLDI